jgi:ATP-binding cassette, subfamily B, bacterial PglK
MDLVKKIFFFFNFSNKVKTLFFILSNFILSLLEIIGLSMLIPLLGVLFQTEEVISNNILKDFSSIVSNNFTTFTIISLIFLIYLFKSIFYLSLINWKLKFINNISILISKKLLKRYMNGDQEYFYKKNSGELLRNVINENRKVTKALSAAADLLIDLTLLLTSLTFLSFINFQTTIIIFVILIMFTIIYFIFLKKLLIKFANKDINLMAEGLKFLVESFRGYSEIFINNKQQFFINRYIDKDQLILKFKRYGGVIKVLPRTLLELTIVIIVLYFLLNLTSIDKNLNNVFFNLTIYGAVFFRLYPSIGKSIANIQTIISCKPSLYLIDQELNKDEKKIISKNQKELSKDHQIESINFKNVTFSYNNGKKILNNFNKVVKKSSIIGITGNSGVGKSTLVHLLSGILKPLKGEIIVDGIELNNLKNWNDKIAYVSQKPFIMDSTIRSNICLGDDQVYNQSKMNDIYVQAGIDGFIDSLEMKDLSKVGEGGNFVSGGQIQRIGIARALYKEAQIFLLDEITSNLDDNIQNKILENLVNLKNDKIIFLISHDKKILEYCDDFINL